MACIMIIQMAKSKTVWFSILIMALGIIEVNFSMLQENLGEYYGISFMVISIVMGVLRMVTIKPIADK